jgi:hypothetical protein
VKASLAALALAACHTAPPAQPAPQASGPTAQPATPARTSDFGFYLLAMSWAPARCTFTLHGLWPNFTDEHLSLEAAAGAAYYFRQLYSAGFRTGQLLGTRASLELDGGYEIRPRDVFYGVGNALMPETRYSQHRSRALVTGDVRVWSNLHLRPAGAVAERSFGAPSQGTPTADLYMPVAFASGYSSAYGELEVRWDGREAVGDWDPHGAYTGGSLAAAFIGRFHRLDAGPDFWRYGFDLQHFIRLGIGPRTLLLRLRGEGVTGRADEVPFTSTRPSSGRCPHRTPPASRACTACTRDTSARLREALSAICVPARTPVRPGLRREVVCALARPCTHAKHGVCRHAGCSSVWHEEPTDAARARRHGRRRARA